MKEVEVYLGCFSNTLSNRFQYSKQIKSLMSNLNNHFIIQSFFLNMCSVTAFRQGFFHFITRLCGLLGGVFVTCGILLRWSTKLYSYFHSKSRPFESIDLGKSINALDTRRQSVRYNSITSPLRSSHSQQSDGLPSSFSDMMMNTHSPTSPLHQFILPSPTHVLIPQNTFITGQNMSRTDMRLSVGSYASNQAAQYHQHSPQSPYFDSSRQDMRLSIDPSNPNQVPLGYHQHQSPLVGGSRPDMRLEYQDSKQEGYHQNQSPKLSSSHYTNHKTAAYDSPHSANDKEV